MQFMPTVSACRGAEARHAMAPGGYGELGGFLNL